MGCFDKYVNADLEHLKAHYSAVSGSLDHSSAYFALDTTQWALGVFGVFSLILALLFICFLQSLRLLCDFKRLDDIVPSVEVIALPVPVQEEML